MAATRHDREPRSTPRRAGERVRSSTSRVGAAWRALDPDRRLAALCALGLFVTMLLPWYTKTDFVVSGGGAKVGSVSLSAFQAFSFVEAAVLLVSAGVLAILFARAEGRAFHLPGGDGMIIMIAGAWAAILIFFRLLDKPGLQGAQRITASVGVTWGIFLALLVAIGLAVAGARVRAGHRPELLTDWATGRPDSSASRAAARSDRAQLDLTEATVADPPAGRPRSEPGPKETATPGSSPRPRYPPAPGQRGRMVTREDAAQLSFEDTSATEAFGQDSPHRRPEEDPPSPRRRRG